MSSPITKRLCRRTGLKVQPLCGGEVCVPAEKANMVCDLKNHLCSGTQIQPQWLRVIASGKELCDEVLLSSYAESKVFVMLRCDVSHMVTLRIKQSLKDPGTAIEIPLNAKVNALRTEVQRVTGIPRTVQRLILCGSVLHDTYLLGDYLLRKRSKDLSVLVTRTVDTSGEVDVVLPLRDSLELKLRVGISSPLADLIESLHTRYAIPRDTKLQFTYNGVVMQPHMRWFDYGVTADMKQVKVQMGVLPKVTLTHVAPNVVSYTIQSPPPVQIAVPVPKTVQKLPETVTSREKSASSMFRGMKRGFLSNPKPKKQAKENTDNENKEA